MGKIADEFRQELDVIARRHAADPRKELLRLFLLALEREELVAVNYRQTILSSRLAAMPVGDDVRSLIEHAFAWIWKDEEMHAVYVRGAIMRLGGLRLRCSAFLAQAGGCVAGWSSSVLQHSRWRHAPLSRSLAGMTKLLGAVLGKVPRNVNRHLRYGPLRDFCRFNVDAEETAWLCWERIIELVESLGEWDEAQVADFRRVAQDERNHARIFEIFAEALDEHDGLVAGHSPDILAERIRDVGQEFLPRSRRHPGPQHYPLGQGGNVHCLRADTGQQKEELFLRLLEESQLAAALRARAEDLGRGVGSLRVAVKPSFMLGYHLKDPSPITDPRLLELLARYLREQGCEEVAIVEGQNLYDHFYENRRVLDVARYFHLSSSEYRIVDASEEQVPHSYARGIGQWSVSRTWKEADFRISFAKLRSHPVELALLCVGNVESVGARSDEFLFLDRHADRATGVMMLLDEFPPHYGLVDAFEQVPDGLVGVMGCRRPRAPRRLYAGADILAVDGVVSRHLGIRKHPDSSLLQEASHWFGGDCGTTKVCGCDEPIEPWKGPYSNELWALLSFLALPVYVVGSRRGSLFVPEMDEAAFPLRQAESTILALGRGAMRLMLGLRNTGAA